MHALRATTTGLVGGLLALLYLALSFVALQVLLFPVVGRLDPVPTVLAVVVVALGVGYLTYRLGTAQLISGIGATTVTQEQEPDLYHMARRLDAVMAVDQPRILLTRTGEPNAFSIGGRRGAVVLDASLVDLLSPEELEAVMAHELAHLETSDSLVKTMGASVVSTTSNLLFLVFLPVGLVVAVTRLLVTWIFVGQRIPIRLQLVRAYVGIWLAVLVVMGVFTLALRAHSRRQEYVADDRAAEVTSPAALANAFTRIQQATDPEQGVFSSLYVHGSEDGPLTRLLATHPSMDDRIERLEHQRERGDSPIPRN